MGLFECLPHEDLELRINTGLRPHAFEKATNRMVSELTTKISGSRGSMFMVLILLNIHSNKKTAGLIYPQVFVCLIVIKKTIVYVKEKLSFLPFNFRVFAVLYPSQFCPVDDIVKGLHCTGVHYKG